jgi:hypothetical protein
MCTHDSNHSLLGPISEFADAAMYSARGLRIANLSSVDDVGMGSALRTTEANQIGGGESQKIINVAMRVGWPGHVLPIDRSNGLGD